MGQRKSDPYCNELKLETHCSEGWPDLIRINPILDWNYNDIWNFLIKYKIEYCKLYDKGYTSLGSYITTIKNPLLFDIKNNIFKPAYLLKYGNTERFGRVITQKNNNNNNNYSKSKTKIIVLLHSNDKTFWDKNRKVLCIFFYFFLFFCFLFFFVFVFWFKLCSFVA